jgi:hypothetical protein
MSNKLKDMFRNVHEHEHKIWFTIEDIETIIDKYNESNSNPKALIEDYLESNGLDLHKDHVITTKHKLDGESKETLQYVLEGFFEYLKYHK